jgi:hypothetical protein
MTPEEIKKRFREGMNAADKRSSRQIRWSAAMHKSRRSLLLRRRVRAIVKFGVDSEEVKWIDAELKIREVCTELYLTYEKSIKFGVAKRAEMDLNP